MARRSFGSACALFGLAAAGITPRPRRARAQETVFVLGEQIASVRARSVTSDRIDVIARTTDGRLVHKWSIDDYWVDWEQLARGVTAEPVLVPRADGNVAVLMRGEDGALSMVTLLEWARERGEAHEVWRWLDGSTADAPAVCSWDGLEHFSVFVRGTDDALWRRERIGGQPWQQEWREWESLGGALGSAPRALTESAQRLDVFARAPSGGLLHRALDAGRWGGEELLGDVRLVDAPELLARGPGRIDLVHRDPSDHALHWGRYEAGGYRALGVIPGTEGSVGTPQLLLDARGGLRVLVRSADGDLLLLRSGTGWSRPVALARGLAADAAAVWRGPDRLDVFSIDADGVLAYVPRID